MTSSSFNSGGFNQFFHAEGLAVDARKSEVHETWPASDEDVDQWIHELLGWKKLGPGTQRRRTTLVVWNVQTSPSPSYPSYLEKITYKVEFTFFFRWGLVCSMKPIEPVLQNLRISFGPPRGMWSCWEDLPGQGERIKTAATKGYYSSLSLHKALQNPCFSGVIQLPNK